MDLTNYSVYEFSKKLGEETIAKVKKIVEENDEGTVRFQMEDKGSFLQVIEKEYGDDENTKFNAVVNGLSDKLSARGVSMSSHGAGYVAWKRVNGVYVEMFDESDDSTFGLQETEWVSRHCSLIAEFDENKYLGLYEKLQGVLKKHLPEDEYEVAEDNWLDGEPHLLINDCWWYTKDLNEIKAMLDELNILLLPIKNDLEMCVEGTWFNEKINAAAAWRWDENCGLEIVATRLL